MDWRSYAQSASDYLSKAKNEPPIDALEILETAIIEAERAIRLCRQEAANQT